MALSDVQLGVWLRIRAVCSELGTSEFTYRSEWLGYFPFGAYHWIEIRANEIKEMPSGWSRADLLALEAEELVRCVESWQSPNDEFESTMLFNILAGGLPG
jgi:hypothetical protein